MARRLPAGSQPCVNAPCFKKAVSGIALLSMLGITSLTAVMMMPAGAMAQAYPEHRSVEAPRGLQLDRAGTIQRLGLGDPALELTDAQKAQIDRAAAKLVSESEDILDRYPLQQEVRQPDRPTVTALNQAGMDALNQARVRFTDFVKSILTQEQREIWEARRSGRAPRLERGTPGNVPSPERQRPR